MLSKIKRKIPYGLKLIILKAKHLGFGYYCNSCNSHIKRFYPGGINEKIIADLEIIGAGYKEMDYCPICKASYRQRLQMLYLKQQNEPKEDSKLLHIAPEECLYYYLKKRLKTNYICGDLEPERYNYYANPIKINLTRIDLPSESFDIIVCNHVLEHIADDIAAMRELFRVLKTGGMALLQVPISLKLEKTYEDINVASAKERLKKFGQEDHVRVYAMDYVDRLESVGFIVEIIQASALSNLPNYSKIALDPRESLFICHRK